MRPEILLPLFEELKSIKGIGDKTARWLKYLCGSGCVIDMLWHLPASVKHRIFFDKNPPLDEPIRTRLSVKEYVVPKIKRLPLRIICQADFGRVDLIFFHYHLASMTSKFPIESKIFVAGTLHEKENYYEIIHPDGIALLSDKIPEYQIIYPMTEGKTSATLTRLMENVWQKIPELPEWLDEEVIHKNHFLSWKQSLFCAHHPKMISDCSRNNPARQRLIYDELLAHQLSLKLIRQYHQQQMGIGCPLKNTIKLNLPFQLTKAQQKVLYEISDDLSAPFPMNRLLQGDVGSGKTIVAVLSALHVIANNHQVALMAPTDILARQHYGKIQKLLAKSGVQVALLTAKEKGKVRKAILNNLVQGKIQFLIGTHALIEDNVQFQKLGLAIVDEQHRFGVNQRLDLIQKQKGCNLLVMSATPIPRSLAMTTYGDMDISVLDEKPKGRQSILTRVMTLGKIPQLVEKLKETTAQVYWVCPLVSESEKSDLMAAEKRYHELKKEFGDFVGLIHGKMKADEKESVMHDFQMGKIRILVSTTVIEVGVDVPNASIMIVEHAERFGLATLHQLRGRVGRGNQSSFCVLLHGRLGENGKERLDILRRSDNGFEISNKDLQMRGAGEVLGLRQSGFQQYRLAQLPEDQNWLELAAEQAQKILQNDPHLEKNKNLRILLYLFEREKAIMTLKAG